MTNKFVVLDPTLEVVAEAHERANRPSGFKTIGLVDNGKANSDRLLQKVALRVKTVYPDVIIKTYHKPAASRPAPVAMLDQLADECDVAIVGIGD